MKIVAKQLHSRMLLCEYFAIFLYLYLRTVQVSCEEGSTLAFAIDDTLSMSDDISYVKKGAQDIMNLVFSKKNSTIKDLVLVTINDPDVKLRTHTNSRATFLAHLNNVTTNNYRNYDCPEMTLTGIETALETSRPASYIYVFTDGNAKDHDKINRIKTLCQKKQSQVVIVFTIARDCYRPEERRFTVYYDVAKACSGQVFVIEKEQVKSVLKTIEVLLQGKNSIFKWITVKRTAAFVPIAFKLDEKAEYAIVSTSGRNVYLRITTKKYLWSPEPAYQKTMWNNNGRVAKLLHPKPGTYYAWVRGDSTISVVVYGRTDFTFDYGFSILRPKSIADTAKQPTAGLKQHLSIKVTDPDHSVNIKTVQILDIKNNDRIIKELHLKNIGKDFYITDTFDSPKVTFRIAIKGEIKRTNETILRNSRTNVDPRIVDLIPRSRPDVKIKEGSTLHVNYGSEETLTCEVSGHPKPKIDWYTSRGHILPSKSSVIDDPVFVSYLKLRNIRRNDTFICKASNNLGRHDISIQVGVRPVFRIISTTNGTSKESVVNAKYGEDVKIACNIKSYLPITISWFRSGEQLHGVSGEHSISRDGSELTLKVMSIAMQGQYTCKATLSSNAAVAQSRNFEVKIYGIVRPKIQSSNKNIIVRKQGKIEMKCNVVRGNPKPQMKWFKRTGISYTPLVNVNSETLTVDKATFVHGGQYKCEATNAIGTDTATFDVVVSGSPEISITEVSREITYDSNVEITCKVKSYPSPSIVWKDKNGSILQTKATSKSEYEFYNTFELRNVRRSTLYTCEASNNVGSVIENVNITVTSPFKIINHIQGEIKTNYGKKETLRCDIISIKPMRIRWYIQKSGDKSSRSAISSSDKYTISGDGTKLTIKSMDVDTAGTYTCEASLLSAHTEEVAYSVKVDVVGLSSPEITNYTTVTNDKHFTAICRIKGVPKPIISWQFKSKGSEIFNVVTGSEEELNIPELRLNDTGVYKCIAENSLGKAEHDFNVTVEEPPIIKNEERTYFGVEGDLVVKIPCEVTGFPEPTITWKNGSNDLNIGSKYAVKKDALYINMPAQYDSADYTCEAKNQLGTVIKTFGVVVVDSFPEDENFIDESNNVLVEENKSEALICNLTNAGNDSVRWYKDGMFTNRTGITYTIEGASDEDGRNFTCRANTEEGSTSQTFVVYVGSPPRFSSNLPSPVTVDWKTNDDILDCAAEAQPDASYKWSRNGKAVEVGNGLKQIRVTDWGEYTCHVSNVHGNISKTFKVITLGCYINKHSAMQNQPLASDKDSASWPSSISNSDVLLEKNNEIKLSCPNNNKTRNAFKIMPNKQEIIAKCETQDKFSVDGRTYRYSDLGCNNKVESTMVSTREQCAGPNSEMIRVGFEVNGFLDAYKVCYNRRLHVPMHASASTYLSRSGGEVDLSKFNWSSASELGNRRIGDWGPEGSCKCCYTMGQLVTVSEIAFGPAQAATFKDNLNLVPVWNPCDDSRTSWQDFVSTLDDKWTTWTGASEYSNKDGIYVPRYLWKVIDSDEETGGGATVMVYVNGGAPTERDARCPGSACEPLGAQDPLLYCCTLADFTAGFHLPPDAFKTD